MGNGPGVSRGGLDHFLNLPDPPRPLFSKIGFLKKLQNVGSKKIPCKKNTFIRFFLQQILTNFKKKFESRN